MTFRVRYRRAASRHPAPPDGPGVFGGTPGRTRQPRRWHAALGLGVVLALATSATATSPEFTSLGLEAPKEEVEAPDFSLPDLSERKIRLKDFRGKVVLLNFFATWCVPCRLEMPAMERLHRAYKDKGLVVLAVDIRESAKTVRAFTQDGKILWRAFGAREWDSKEARQYFSSLMDGRKPW